MNPSPPKRKRGLDGAALSSETKRPVRYRPARALQAAIWAGWLRHAKRLADEYRRTSKASHLEAFRRHCAEMRAWRTSRARRRLYVEQVRRNLALCSREKSSVTGGSQ